METARAIAKPIKRSLWKSTSLVAFMTALSRILGFVRDVVTAHLFGAGMGMDAFLVAFKIPNFLRRLFAEGAFSQAFVPILSEYQQSRSEYEVRAFISNAAGMLGTALFIVTLVSMIAAPLLVFIFAPGFKPDSARFIWAVDMLRITFPYLLFISLAAFAGAILNTYGAFGIPAFTPVLLNVSMIMTAFLLSPYLNPSIDALAWGVFIGGILQLLFQIPYLMRFHLMPTPRFHWRDPAVRRMLKQMVPVLFGVSVSQINLLFDTLLASFLAIGSVSWLYFSDRITSLPLGIFGVALATVTLPHLARKYNQQEMDGFSQTLDWALRNILLISVPAAIGLIILAKPLLTTLFQYGKFNYHDVLMTEKSLIAFALGIPAFMAVKVLASAFYATHNVRTPVKIATIAMITNICLNIALIFPLAHAGLALATTLAAFLNAGLLAYQLNKQKIFRWQSGWGIFALRMLFANGTMAALLLWQIADITVWQSWSWFDRGIHLGFWIALAFTCYAGCLFISGLRLRDLTVH